MALWFIEWHLWILVCFKQKKSSSKNFYISTDVPVFRVRATTASASSTIKTDAKPISVANPTSICYDTKQTHNTTTTSGSVSVLACFKTTKKRTKVCYLVTISVFIKFFSFGGTIQNFGRANNSIFRRATPRINRGIRESTISQLRSWYCLIDF